MRVFDFIRPLAVAFWFRLFGVLFWTLLLFAVFVDGAQGAAPTHSRILPTELPLLANFVPADVGIFLQIDELPRVGLRHQNRDMWWELLRVAGGGETQWRQVVADAFGMGSGGAGSGTPLLRIFGEHVALAAEDWGHVGEGVILFTQSDTKLLRALLRPSRARRGPSVGKVRIYRAVSGLWIAMRHDAVILSQTRGPGTLFDRCVQLLDGADIPRLLDAEGFQAQVSALPSPRDGVAYWNTSNSSASTTAYSAWWPSSGHGALSLQVRGDEIVVSVRSPGEPRNADDEPFVDRERLLALPQSTLVAWATTIDVTARWNALMQTTAPPPLEKLWRVFESKEMVDHLEERILRHLGKRCVFFVCADFDSDDLAPQFGLLIESTDDAAVVAGLRELLTRSATGGVDAIDTAAIDTDTIDTDTVGTTSPAKPAEPTRLANTQTELVRSEYLDTVIYATPWGDPKLDRPSDTLASLAGDDIAPAFAALRGWVALASSPKLIHKMVDSMNGLSPRLGDVAPMRRLEARLTLATRAMIVQPSFAQGTLRYWETILCERRKAYTGRTRLGVTVIADPQPGQVLIADVDTNGPSAGHILPGDAILACNNELLPMADANRHLKSLLAAASPGEPVLLRLRRGDRIIEVSLAPHREATMLSEPTDLGSLLERIGPWEILAKELDTALYTVRRRNNGAFAASLKLKFDVPRRPLLGQPHKTGTK